MESEISEDVFKIYNQDIFLRDMCMEDVDDYIVWNTNEIEWQDWDAPWEKEENSNIEELKDRLFEKSNAETPIIRRRLEICNINGKHIGWVSSYFIDGDKSKFAIGIDIANNKFRGKKLGELAFSLFISYLLKSEYVSDIYTQTWSGNYRMIGLAKKCGFEVVSREINFRKVRGNMYDDLTFKLNKELFWNRFKQLRKKDVPTLQEARVLLEEAEKIFPGRWVQHSLWTAQAAKLISENCEELNSEVAYVLGMLHDIGRRNGLTNGLTTIGHMLVGYNYSKKLGYDLLAKICMTHSCPSKSINDIEEVVNKSCNNEDYKIVKDFFSKVEYDDYDKLIQLCDALALPNGFTLMEKRLVDVALRHGVNEYIVTKWKAFMELKNYFEKKMGKSIYSVLPNVIENTFEL
ncbi:GNAT family N-acetyltransferase [Haloimpatiens sp. FM7330]|uniref:GNAT family N-acetyltransferase n=1 Tax=Haloimpatiens sp. FM7330 TaxID=3298610 RepID=UPI003644D64C